MNGNEKITVEKTHTDEMISDELKSMLGVCEIRLTLGALASLVVLKSPYVFGGDVTADNLAVAFEIVQHTDMKPEDFNKKLQVEIDTAFRVFSTIVPDDKDKPAKTSEMDTFSPEWFADIMAQACQSMPSLTYEKLMTEIPLTLVFHLAVSSARRNGAITRRPDDTAEALRKFKEMRARK